MVQRINGVFQKQKKRMIALMLSAAMVLSLLVPSFTFSAFAAGELTGGTVRTTTLDLTTEDYKTEQGVVNSGALYTNSAEGWSYDTNGNILTLSGVNIKSEDITENGQMTLGINLPEGVTIVLAEGTTNIVRSGNATGSGSSSAAVFSDSDSDSVSVTIQGTGSLHAISGTATLSSFGIAAKNITITGGTTAFTSGTATSNSFGMYVFNDLNITGGTVTATGAGAAGILVNTGFILSGGKVTVSGSDYGYYSFSNRTSINGGLLIARSDKAADKSGALNITPTVGSGMALLTGSNTANFAVYGESGKYYVMDNKSGSKKDGMDGYAQISDRTGLDCTKAVTDVENHITWANNTLALKNVIINVDTIGLSDNTYGIALPDAATLMLQGTNVIRGGDTTGDYKVSSGVYTNNSLSIDSTGSLHAFGGTAINKDCGSYGIRSGVTININGGIVTAIGGMANFISAGISANNGIGTATINISGGTVLAIGGMANDYSRGITANKAYDIKDSTGAAIGGTANSSQAFSMAPTFTNDYVITSGAWDSNIATWGLKPKSDITKDLFTFTKPDNLTYNAQAKAATVKPSSSVSGTGAITIYYSNNNGTTWTTDAPTEVGTYKVKIDVAAGTGYNHATDIEIGDFTISYLATPSSPYSLSGGNIVSDTYWSNKNTVLINPAAGYTLVNKDGTAFTGTITTETGANSVKFHLKNTDGSITDEISVAEAIKFDKTAPTGTIIVKENKWTSFLNKITFGIFFKETQDVTIDGSDTNGSGIAKIEYYISNEDLVNDESGTANKLEVAVNNNWKNYDNGNKPSLSPAKRYVVYAKITDNCGNISYVNSNGVVLFEDVIVIDGVIDYTKFSANPDNTVTLSLKGNTIKEIKIKDTIIDTNNYSISTIGENTTITFNKVCQATLDSFPTGSYTMTISYNPLGVETDTATVVSSDITVNVALAEQMVTMPPETKPYNGSTQEIKKAIIKGVTGAAAPTESLTYTYYTDAACTTKTTTANSRAATEGGAPKNAGIYSVKATNAGDANYSIATSTASILTISPRDITISGITASNKEYDGDTTAKLTMPTITTAMGLVDGDTVTATANGTFADKNVGTGKTVNIAGLTLAGADKANYKLAASGQQTTTTASITPKELTINVEVNNKNYDGLNAATIKTASLVDVVKGDDVTLNNGTPTFASVNLANGIVINFTAFTIDGTDKDNYTLTQPTGVTANISTGFTPDKDTHYTINSNDWLNNSFVIASKSNYQVSLTNTANGSWRDTLECSDETANGSVEFYVKNITSGEISVAATESYKIDKTAPTGDIKFNDSTVKKVLNAITFGWFFNDTVNVEITSDDGLSGVASTEYFKSETVLTQTEIEAVSDWKEYSSFGITPTDKEKFIIYVRITDNAGNVTYFGSDGLTFDTTVPMITGVKSGMTYYTTQKLTATDDNIDTIKLNEADFTSGETITGNVDKTYTLVATDKAGNKTSVTVKMKPIANLSSTIDGLTAANVEFNDKETIENVETKVKAINITNATDEEKNALKAITDKCNELLKVIDDAAKVIDLINSLPEVKDVKESDKDKIDEAKQAYNDLSAHQKELVGTELSNKLVALETAIVNFLLKDKPTGTTIEAIGDTTFDINVVLVVKPVAPTENTKVSVTGIASGKEMVALYDISLMLGDQKIQPNGKVRVTLTLTDEQLKGYKDFRIVYVDQNGESTVIESVLNGNQISFETDHFSGYGVIGTKIAKETTTTKETSPVTGDSSNIKLWFALLFVSGGALFTFGINKKRKKANSK